MLVGDDFAKFVEILAEYVLNLSFKIEDGVAEVVFVYANWIVVLTWFAHSIATNFNFFKPVGEGLGGSGEASTG